MKVLIDSQVLLWTAGNFTKLSPIARKMITDPAVERLFSTASAWEITIKASLGKLNLGTTPARFFAELPERLVAEPLNVELHHALRVYDLPDHHRDPFDRLIIAQALSEKLPVITADPIFKKYKVQVIW